MRTARSGSRFWMLMTRCCAEPTSRPVTPTGGLYMSATLARVGAPAALMRARHLLTPRRADACQWLGLIGRLYAHPAEVGTAGATSL